VTNYLVKRVEKLGSGKK